MNTYDSVFKNQKYINDFGWNEKHREKVNK